MHEDCTLFRSTKYKKIVVQDINVYIKEKPNRARLSLPSFFDTELLGFASLLHRVLKTEILDFARSFDRVTIEQKRYNGSSGTASNVANLQNIDAMTKNG